MKQLFAFVVAIFNIIGGSLLIANLVYVSHHIASALYIHAMLAAVLLDKWSYSYFTDEETFKAATS